MPISLARRHNDFLEEFFKTGRKTVFNTKRTFYGIKKDGTCFCLNLLVKQIPSFVEGIQYAGMIRAVNTDNEYILTDNKGLIECCSRGIPSLLSLPCNIFKENKINIQILAPDLMIAFGLMKRNARNKFYEGGGQKVTFIVPKDSTFFINSDIRKRDIGKSSLEASSESINRKAQIPGYFDVNKSLNEGSGMMSNQIDLKKLLQSLDYIECEVKCKIIDCTYGEELKGIEPVKLKVFEIKNAKKVASNMDNEFSDLHIELVSGGSTEFKEENMEEEFMSMTPRRADIEEIKVTEKLPGNLVTTEIRTRLNEEVNSCRPDIPLDIEGLHEDSIKEELTPRMNLSVMKAPYLESVYTIKYNTERSVESLSDESLDQVSKESHLNLRPDNNLLDNRNKANTVVEDKLHLNTTKIAFKKRYNKTLQTIKQDSVESSTPLSKFMNEGKLVTSVMNVSKSKDESAMKAHLEKVDINKNKQQKQELLSINMAPIKGFLSRTNNMNDIKKSFISARSLSKSQKIVNDKVITDERYDPENMELHDYKYTEDEMKLRRSLLDANIKKNKEKKQALEDVKIDVEENKKEKEDFHDQEDEEEESEKEEKKVVSTNSDLQASIANSIKSTSRSLCSLRAAIDEKYIPNSIKNMDYAAKGVFLILFALVISYFIVELTLRKSLKQTIGTINYSERRIEGVIIITLQSLNLMIITSDYKQHEAGVNENNLSFINDSISITGAKFLEIQGKLRTEVTELKFMQAELSVNSNSLSEEVIRKINPEHITLYVVGVPGLPNVSNFTMWQTMLSLASAGFQLANIEIFEVDDSLTPEAYFITRNALNNIFVNMYTSTWILVDEVESKKNSIITVYLIIFSVASLILLISTILLLPVISKINKNKQEVLELFMYIRSADANEELNKCRKFLGVFQVNPETEMILGEESQNEEDEVHKNLERGNKTRDYGIARRKFKELRLNLGLMLYKSIFLILIMEGYFLLNFLLSRDFLNRTISLTKEFALLIEKYPSNSLLLLMEK